MKKTTLLFALLFGLVSLYGNTISKKDLNLETALDPWVEIYTQANYAGVKITVTGGTNYVSLPIANTPGYKIISVKVQPGYVAYINVCNEFNDEVMVYGNRPSLTLYALCTLTIKAEPAAFMRVQFQGFTTNIHNNDCRKIFGSVRLKMFENRPGGGITTNIVTMQNNIDVSTINRLEAVVFSRFSASDTSLPNCVSPYVFDSTFVPNFHEALVNQEGTSGIYVIFVAGESAISERRTGFVSTSNLHTAHKMNDFATYYSNIQLTPTAPLTKLTLSLPNIPGSSSLVREKILQFGFYTNPPQNSGDSGHLVKILMSVF